MILRCWKSFPFLCLLVHPDVSKKPHTPVDILKSHCQHHDFSSMIGNKYLELWAKTTSSSLELLLAKYLIIRTRTATTTKKIGRKEWVHCCAKYGHVVYGSLRLLCVRNTEEFGTEVRETLKFCKQSLIGQFWWHFRRLCMKRMDSGLITSQRGIRQLRLRLLVIIHVIFWQRTWLHSVWLLKIWDWTQKEWTMSFRGENFKAYNISQSINNSYNTYLGFQQKRKEVWVEGWTWCGNAKKATWTQGKLQIRLVLALLKRNQRLFTPGQ